MDDIRTLVRQLLQEELNRVKKELSNERDEQELQVRIENDTDLFAFVCRIAEMSARDDVRRKLLNGDIHFRLQQGASHNASVYVPPSHNPVHNTRNQEKRTTQHQTPTKNSSTRAEFLTGMVTEKNIDTLATTVRTVMLAKGVYLTPLAIDELKRRNIKIERMEK